MDFQASVDRVEQELLRLGEHGLDTATWCRAADGLLDRLVGFDGSCWHTIDPATVLITSHLTLNLPGRFPLLTAIFDKVGVRSRGELVGQVFFRHCLPAIPD